ncbi:MAG: protein kinase [Polyangiaceae bacterium]|nr:protein kinase [Polyangiaceae bacterium]
MLPSTLPDPVRVIGAGSPPAVAASRPVFASGELVADTYRVTRLLGEGGMGQVYEAQDLSLGRTVALKVACTPEAAPALRAEARAIACIRHPALVTLHCVVSHGANECLVMERIYGASLEAHLAARRAEGQILALDEVLAIGTGIASGLSALHRAGLAHRDLKPGNVMLAPGGRVVLMDLGIGLPECALSRGDAVAAAGTPAYMAPESIVGAVQPGALHLTDLYGLGVILFELCAGEPPFAAATLGGLLEAQLHAPPPRLAALRPDVPAALDALVDALLDKDPGARPTSIEEVLLRLCALQRRPRPEAAPRSVPSRLGVLVVAEEPAMRKLLGALARSHAAACEVRCVSSGAAALALAGDLSPRLVLLDPRVSDMNAIELCSCLRGQAGTTPAALVVLRLGLGSADQHVLAELGVELVSFGRELARDLAPLLRAQASGAPVSVGRRRSGVAPSSSRAGG